MNVHKEFDLAKMIDPKLEKKSEAMKQRAETAQEPEAPVEEQEQAAVSTAEKIHGRKDWRCQRKKKKKLVKRQKGALLFIGGVHRRNTKF